VELNINPTLAAVTLIQFPKRLKKKNLDLSLMDERMILRIFKTYREGILPKDSILTALELSIKKGKYYPEMLPRPATIKEAKVLIEECSTELSQIKLRDYKNAKKIIMSQVMEKLRMKIDAAIVYNYVTKIEV